MSVGVGCGPLPGSPLWVRTVSSGREWLLEVPELSFSKAMMQSQV